jgi:alpha-acetolactate decarboxylase
LDHGEIAISTFSELHLSLQRSQQFLAADLSPSNVSDQIRQAEGG